ncbi:MAG TPA: 16S rRNA processing protein RimM [Clostridiales bacterium]|nr:16S rRNA processing protein RimM [Clostridiales bacterium]
MKILMGTVLRPQGINGEIKVSDFTDGEKSLKKIKKVYIGGVEYPLLKLSGRDNALFLQLGGVFDRNAAEDLRGKDVYCEKEEILKNDDSYFIEDIVGSDLYLTSGKKIGKIVNVFSSNVDIFTLETSEGEAYLPFLKNLNAVVDLEEKRVTVDASRFTEVISYREKN